MIKEGYIKLHRSITDWEWYQNANTSRLFIHLLLTVNYYPKKWQGIVVERGQRVTSIRVLSAELKLSERSIRTAVNHLKATNELTIKTTPKHSLITINNYELYQELTNELTNKRQTNDKQTTNNRQQSKKDKKDKNDKKESNAHFEEFWKTYPRKVGKKEALKSWEKIKPDTALIEKIIQAVEDAKLSKQWQKDNGQYIPHPTTWLNQGRWDDEHETNKVDCPL